MLISCGKMEKTALDWRTWDITFVLFDYLVYSFYFWLYDAVYFCQLKYVVE